MTAMENKTTENTNKSLVMKSAWALVKAGDVKSLGEAMKLAWKAIKLRAQMANGVVEFKYRTLKGDVCNALGTIKSEMINYTYKNSNRKPCYRVVSYFDVHVNMFRSFAITRLM